ncbi:MAG TPA: POTRA domain-containing protein, partial [Blastocatellia bacterium]
RIDAMIKSVSIFCSLSVALGLFVPDSGLAFGRQPAAVNALAKQAQEATVERVVIAGNRRIPESTIMQSISTKAGDTFDPATIDRDVRALYAQGHFADIRSYVEDGPKDGKIVTFEVREWPLVLAIEYQGLKSVSLSRVAKEYRKLGITFLAEYDPGVAKRAAATIRDLLVRHGHPDATVNFTTEDVTQTRAVKLTFMINEGPSAPSPRN